MVLVGAANERAAHEWRRPAPHPVKGPHKPQVRASLIELEHGRVDQEGVCLAHKFRREGLAETNRRSPAGADEILTDEHEQALAALTSGTPAARRLRVAHCSGTSEQTLQIHNKRLM